MIFFLVCLSYTVVARPLRYLYTRSAVKKTRSYLIFAFEYQHVGDFAERYAQMYDFSLGHLIGYVAYVYHAGRLVVGSLVEFHLSVKKTPLSITIITTDTIVITIDNNGRISRTCYSGRLFSLVSEITKMPYISNERRLG